MSVYQSITNVNMIFCSIYLSVKLFIHLSITKQVPGGLAKHWHKTELRKNLNLFRFNNVGCLKIKESSLTIDRNGRNKKYFIII